MKASAVIQFTWPRPAEYEWIEARPISDEGVRKPPTQVLVAKGLQYHDLHRDMPHYRPLDEQSGLFRELASTEPTPDAVLEFALKYGPLSLQNLFVPAGVHVDVQSGGLSLAHRHARAVEKAFQRFGATVIATGLMEQGAVIGDSLDQWKTAIEQLRELLHVWDVLQSNNRKAVTRLVRVIKWKDRDTAELLDHKGQLLFDHSLPLGRTAEMSRRALAELLLMLALQAQFEERCRFYLHIPGVEQKSHFALMPHSLRNAVWLQFVLAVLENKTYRECEVCGKAFELSPKVFRTNRTLCSSACKARAHRMRQAKAFALADKGLAARKIAKQVGSEISTVERWLRLRKDH